MKTTTRPIGPVWSGRHPVTVEITGSNPVWVACMVRYSIATARYANGIAAKLKPSCLWVRIPPVLLGARTMNTKQFTLRLANGREETFANASAMVEWMDRHRGMEYRGKQIRFKRPVREKMTQRRQVNTTNEAPLARYANRHSGEA